MREFPNLVMLSRLKTYILISALFFTGAVNAQKPVHAQVRSNHVGFEISALANPNALGAGIFLNFRQRHQVTLQWLLQNDPYNQSIGIIPSHGLQYDFYFIAPGKRFFSPSLFAAFHHCMNIRHNYWISPAIPGTSVFYQSLYESTRDVVLGAALGIRLWKNLLLRSHAGISMWESYRFNISEPGFHDSKFVTHYRHPFSNYWRPKIHVKFSLTWMIRDAFPVVRW